MEGWNDGGKRIATLGGARACVPLAQRPAPLPFGEGGRIDRQDGDPPSLPAVPSASIPTFHYSLPSYSFVYSSSVGGGLTS
jgi:hypothetical protein